MLQIWKKLVRSRRRDRLAARLHEELQFHVDQKIAAGQPVAQAWREVGNRARILELADDVWSLGRPEQLWADLRYAARTLPKSPVFFLLAVAGTALGVAAVTSVFSVADEALLRPLPYPESNRLVVVWDQLRKLGLSRFPVSNANYLDYRAQTAVFEDLAAFSPRALMVSVGDRAQRVAGMQASANFLPLAGGSLELGRWFDPPENHSAQAHVAVLSHEFWQARFGGSPEAIGATMRIDDTPFRVVGVLIPGFGFRVSGQTPDVWIPAALDPDPARSAGQLQALGRLSRSLTLAQARARMQVVAAGLKQRYRTGMGPHGEDGGYSIEVVPLREVLHGSTRPTLYAMVAAGTILLLLSLTNTALLWMGRTVARRREAAVRMALGASRLRVCRQRFFEALLPSLAGGVLALAVTAGALRLLNAAPHQDLANFGAFTVNYRVFFLSSAVILACVVCTSLALTRWVPLGPAEFAGRSESRARPVLLAIQVGLSCALLAPSLLLVSSLTALQRVDPGFRTAGLSTATGTLPPSYGNAAQIAAYYERVEERLAERLGPRNVTVAWRLPLSFGPGGDPFSIEGRVWGSSGAVPQFAHHLGVGREYFSLLRIPILEGRGFDPRDFSEATGAAVVNRTLARAFWPHESPLGKRIVMGAPQPGVAWLTIVGIVADVHSAGLSNPPLPQIYRPFSQYPARTASLIAGGAGALDHILAALDPEAPAYAVQTMEQHLAAALDQPKLRTTLFTAYGLLAFALAAFGVYSLATYAAVRRRREFALRSALGATARRLFGVMFMDTMKPAVYGAAGGLAGAYWLARAMAASLYATKPGEPRFYLAAGLLVLTAAALAGWLGGRRLWAIAPAEVLRCE